MTKEELRKKFLQKRLEISDEEYTTLSQKICERFFHQINQQVISLLHIYIPITKKKEPNTWPIIEGIIKNHKDLKLCVPRINRASEEMEHVYFHDRNQLQSNSWGIPEPISGSLAEPAEIDMVIVPLLCFDLMGNRIGYGRGYYDMFLAECRPDCIKMGISFFEPVTEIVEANAYDIPLDYCLTPEQVYSFSKR